MMKTKPIMAKTAVAKKDTANQAWLSLLFYFGAIFALFMISNVVFAGGGEGKSLGDVAGSITQSMTNLAKLITAVSYVAGIGFAMMGLLKLKAHKDNPTQVPLSQPMVLLIIAAGLIFLPSVISTIGATIFEGGQKADATGGGIEHGGGGGGL